MPISGYNTPIYQIELTEVTKKYLQINNTGVQNSRNVSNQRFNPFTSLI